MNTGDLSRERNWSSSPTWRTTFFPVVSAVSHAATDPRISYQLYQQEYWLYCFYHRYAKRYHRPGVAQLRYLFILMFITSLKSISGRFLFRGFWLAPPWGATFPLAPDVPRIHQTISQTRTHLSSLLSLTYVIPGWISYCCLCTLFLA